MADTKPESRNPPKDKYKLMKKPADRDGEKTDVRITGTGRITTYISYVAKLFHEEDYKFCTIKATGQALAAAVTVAEVLKRRFKGLHQVTKIASTEVVDTYEPKEEGLETIEHK